MIWKEYDGLLISEYGDVKRDGVLLPQSKISKTNRYIAVKLSREPYRWERTHQLVYKAFIGDIKEDMVIDHIDTNRNNNHYTNLEQITQTENIERYYSKRSENYLTKNGKICQSCKTDRPLTHFYLKAKKDIRDWNPDKWRTYCKSCMNKKRKK